MSKEIDGEFLEIVDENDKVIGTESRDRIHKEGLRHREIYVWFYNEEGLFLQLRAKDKEMYPDMLDSAVSGHVEIGDSYLITALKETKEETGVEIEDFDNLIEIGRKKEDDFDKITNKINNTFNRTYIYYFDGKGNDLKVEKDKAQGFEHVKWGELNPKSKISNRIIPLLLKEEYLNLYKKIQKISKNNDNKKSLKQIEKILELSDYNLDNNNWTRRKGAGEKYLLETKKEIDEALDECKKNNFIYLEDELGDIFWVIMQSFKTFKKEGYISSINSILEHVNEKYKQRLDIYKLQETWDEIEKNGLDHVPQEWINVKNRQKKVLKEKHDEKYNK